MRGEDAATGVGGLRPKGNEEKNDPREYIKSRRRLSCILANFGVGSAGIPGGGGSSGGACHPPRFINSAKFPGRNPEH